MERQMSTIGGMEHFMVKCSLSSSWLEIKMTAPEIPGLPGIEIWEELSNIPSNDILSVKVEK